MSLTRNQIFILLILIGLASGSGFYVGHSLLKPSQIGPFLGIFFLPFGLAKDRLKYDRLALWIVLYIFLAAFYNLPSLIKDQLIDLGFIFSTFMVYIAAVLSARAIYKGDKFPAKATLILFATLFVLYVYQVLTETYFILGSDEEKFYSTTFNNANDMNSFVVAFIPLILYFLQLWNPSKLVTALVCITIAGWVVVMGSRFCILAIFIIPLMYLIFSASYIWKLILLSGTGFIGVLLSQVNWASLLEAIATVENPVISRSASRLYLFLYNFEDDKSSSYRLDSYLYAINHADDAIFGTGTKNYDDFFEEGFGADTLVAYAPHSYLSENMIAFGWFGLALVLSMMVTCLSSFIKDSTYRFYGFTTLLLFFMVSFVPSTVIRLPILWFPLFFFTHLANQSIAERNAFSWSWDDSETDVAGAYEEAY